MDPIAEIKQKIDIVDLINAYVPLTKSGRNYKGICPFHSEKTPSFMVSQELQLFKCFGCSAGGDIFKFIGLIEGVDFHQALRQLAEKAGVKIEQNFSDKEEGHKKTLYEITHLAAAFYHFILTKHPEGKDALDYLTKKRKFKEETMQTFNLGFAPESWDVLYRSFTKKGYKIEDLAAAGVIVQRSSGQGYIDKFRNRIMFPLTDISGKIVGFTGRVLDDSKPKYLNSPETPIFHKGSFIFALDKAKVAVKKDGAIVVEGHTDCITAHQYGFKNVVATGGTAFTTTQLQILTRYTKDLILCFDADTAGDSAIQRGIELAEKENFNIKVIVIPAPYKDLDEILNSNLEQAKEILTNPIPIYDFYLISAFKHNDKTTALGKKQIIEELTEKFGKVGNKVVLDYYIKKVAEEMDINEETVKSIFENRKRPEMFSDKDSKTTKETEMIPVKKSPHEYMMALLFKAPLDTAQTIMYKLGQKDFLNPQIQEIFTELKEYILGRKHKFKIEYFISRLNEEQQKIANDLYLWDLGEIADNDKKMEQELETTFDRLKKESAREELKELSEKIKQAELAKDTKLIKELTEKLKILSSRLV